MVRASPALLAGFSRPATWSSPRRQPPDGGHDRDTLPRCHAAARQRPPPPQVEGRQSFSGDSVAHEIKWKEKSLDALKGEVIRLEFFLKKADLYSFRAKTK